MSEEVANSCDRKCTPGGAVGKANIPFHTSERETAITSTCLEQVTPRQSLRSNSVFLYVCDRIPPSPPSPPQLDPSILRVVSVNLQSCASLPDTTPAPKPAGTFALWLQFPGMPNLRQLFRTCYLCQQCNGFTRHISCHSVSIWV